MEPDARLCKCGYTLEHHPQLCKGQPPKIESKHWIVMQLDQYYKSSNCIRYKSLERAIHEAKHLCQENGHIYSVYESVATVKPPSTECTVIYYNIPLP
jgi:hypothetical protein